MLGGNFQALKELLGHADVKMTLRYAHLAPERLRGEMLKTGKPSQNIVTAEESILPTS